MRFLYTRDTWQIEYEDETGKSRSKVSGLAPPKTDFSGQNLSREAYTAAMVEYKKKAMKMWNHCDKSSRPRYDLNNDA